ncbi:putative multicopper oxidase [Xylariaceae sp. FL0016]|nr:putative multicopper oxidase [Xylariaceae sp. FL0016]
MATQHRQPRGSQPSLPGKRCQGLSTSDVPRRPRSYGIRERESDTQASPSDRSNDWDTISLTQTKGNGTGLVVGSIAASFLGLYILTWLLISMDQFIVRSGPGSEDLPSLRLVHEDYILDPDWDFLAPSQTRTYDWIVEERDGSPDGVNKRMTVINGQFPGPLIEINEGDIVVVNVMNKASNSTAIHWHGILQNGAEFMDGAAGITQCPIIPGSMYQYKFNVTGQSGTYFYHAHQGAQALDGLVGPMVVHRRSEMDHPTTPYSSDRVVLLQDWYYNPASSLMREVLSPGVEDAPIPNTGLLNGVNRADCGDHPDRRCFDAKATHLPTLHLARGSSHRIRLINVGGYAWFQVAVDEHDSLDVVEADGTAVEATSIPSLLIAPGQRYSTVLDANQPSSDLFWLRARIVTACFAERSLPENGIDEAKAIIRYSREQRRHEDDDGEDIPENNTSIPQTMSNIKSVLTCKDMTSTTSLIPSFPQPVPPSADHSYYLRVNLAIGDWRLQRGVMNSSSFRPNLKYPSLHRVLDGLAQDNGSFAIEGVNDRAFDGTSELTISHQSTATVDLILQNMDENSHPFHLHGIQMWVLGSGHGYFPGYEALGLRPEGKGLLDTENSSVVANPMKRDTVTVEGFGWTVLRFVADNPGVWLFHCHVIWHSEAGMAMQFVMRTDDLRGRRVPDKARKLCEASEEELRLGAAPEDAVFAGFGDGK